jgi:hypothetical protein
MIFYLKSSGKRREEALNFTRIENTSKSSKQHDLIFAEKFILED